MIIKLIGTGPSLKYKREGKSYRTRSSIYLEASCKILVDVSLDFKEQVEKNKIETIDYILFTHGHFDAIGGIAQLKKWAENKKIEKISAFAEEQTWKVIKRKFKDIDFLEQHIFVIGNTFKLEKEEVIPFRVKHSIQEGFPTVGFNFNDEVTYAEDFENVPIDFYHFFVDKKVVIRDGAGWSKQFFGHRAILADLPDCIQLNNTLTVFTQMGKDVPPHDIALKLMREKIVELKGTPENFELAYDGMIIDTDKLESPTKKQITSEDIPGLTGIRTPASPTGPQFRKPIKEESLKQITSNDIPGLTAPNTPESKPAESEYPKLKGIVVEDAVAQEFAERKIKAFVKTKLGEVQGDIYVCGSDKIYGIVHLNRPIKMTRERILQTENIHGLTQDYIDAKWPEDKYFYMYTFKTLKVFKEPKEYVKPPASMDFLTEVIFKVLKVDLIDMTPDKLSKMSNSEILISHLRLHEWFSNARRDNRPIEDLVNRHSFVLQEMEKRGMKHNPHDELDKLTEKLRRQKKVLENYTDIKDIVLVEDYISLVGSTVECLKEPNDTDILLRPIDKDKVVEVLKNNLKEEIHPVYTPYPHGKSLPLYDLILRRKAQLEFKDSKPQVDLFKYYDSNKLLNIPLEDFMKEVENRKGSILLEPCFKGKKLQIHKEKSIVKIYDIYSKEYIDEELAKEIANMEYPETCVVDGILLSNGLFLINDILVKNSAHYLHEPFLNRKIFLKKFKLDEKSRVKRSKYFRCFNKYEIIASLKRFKENHWNMVIARFASSKYGDVSYKIRLSEVVEKKVEPFTKITPLKPGKAYTSLEYHDIEESWKYWAQGYIDQGLSVEEKYDGLQMIAEKKGSEVKVYFEEAKEDRSSIMPRLSKILLEVSGDFILDGELLEIKNRQQIPRRDLIRWVTTNDIQDDSDLVYNVFDILYTSKDGDITKKELIERQQILDNTISNSKMIKKVKPILVKDKDHYFKSVQEVSSHPNSEGAVIKVITSIYELDGSTNFWAKVKNLKELHVLVIKRNVTRADTYNYECVFGPIKEVEKYNNIVNYKGKDYIHIGRTYNSSLKVNEGNIISVSVAEVLKQDKDGKINYTWDNPVVRNIEVSNPVFSIEEIDKIAELGRSKDYSLNKVDKPEAPYFIVPQDKKKRKFVYQHHYRGLAERGKIKEGDSVHGDLRLDTGEGFLIGFTLFTPGRSTGNFEQDIKNDKFLQGGKDKIQCTTKLTQPLSWLYVTGDSAPGEVGATSKQWAKFFIVANGKFLFGSQRKEDTRNGVTELHEYFLYPEKGSKDIEGRWVIAKLNLKPRKSEEVKLDIDGEELICSKNEYANLYNSALTLPEWINFRKGQLKIIDNLLEQSKNNIVELPNYLINNLKYDKKNFIEEIESYKAISDDEASTTKMTYLMMKPKNQVPYSQQDKNKEWAQAHPESYQI